MHSFSSLGSLLNELYNEQDCESESKSALIMQFCISERSLLKFAVVHL